MFEQINMMDTAETEEYKAFVEKFKPKKTTDDCYTPPAVYDAVADWCAERYGMSRERFVRPFFPGGDYERFEYPDGCAVVDNPPFSILAKITRFYDARGIKYFLFAQSHTMLTGGSMLDGNCTAICTDSAIVYHNGASVRTSFLTNMEPQDVIIMTNKKLHDAICCAMSKSSIFEKHQPAYKYTDNILTVPMVNKFCKSGIEFSLKRNECRIIRVMDDQKAHGKKSGIYGNGLLLSTKAAAEKAAAEKAAAEKVDYIEWRLSDR